MICEGIIDVIGRTLPPETNYQKILLDSFHCNNLDLPVELIPSSFSPNVVGTETRDVERWISLYCICKIDHH